MEGGKDKIESRERAFPFRPLLVFTHRNFYLQTGSLKPEERRRPVGESEVLVCFAGDGRSTKGSPE